MPRLQPVDVSTATGDVREILDATAARLGVIPNYHATAAASAPYLRAQAALVGALSRGGLRAGYGSRSRSPRRSTTVAVTACLHTS